jgi:hypothetical protein
MKTRAWIGVIGVAALLALPILPGAAFAKGGKFVIGASQSVEFRLKGSRGYSISVFGNRETVTLTAKNRDSSAAYMTKGFVSPTRVQAKFGRLGRVSVRFHSHGASRSVPLPPGNCRGEAETVESGTWAGRIEFEGEHAYTAAHAAHARGTVTNRPKQTCSNQQEGGAPPDFQWTILSASSDARAIFSTAFLATSATHPSRDGSGFGAALLEAHSRGMSIVRSINVTAKTDAFALNEEGSQITSATIAPPPPFKGTATFQRTRGAEGSWIGTLTGDFPGRGEVTLAGPEFSAEISRE